MRRIAAFAAALLFAFAAACTVSRVKPEANITIGGSVRTADAAVPGVRLALQREGDVGDVLFTIASIGFACLEERDAPAICHHARYATAGPGGAFLYHLKGRDTQSTFGESAVLSISAALPPRSEEAAGASTTYRFHAQTEKLNLPIRLWEPAVDARVDPSRVRVSFSPPDAGLVPPQLNHGLRYTVEFISGTELVWRVSPAKPITTFDARLLEDTAGTMRVIASASSLHVSESLGDEVAFAMRSGARTYTGPAGVPISRGAPCSVEAAGARYPVAPCRLTDGSFGAGFGPTVCSGATPCSEPPHSAATIDLQRSSRVDLVVLRGCPSACRVEASLDGSRWRLIGVAQGEAAAFPFAQARSERYVRVSGANVVDLLTEISIWGPARPAVPRSLFVSPTPSRTPNNQRALRPAKKSSLSTWVLVLAVGVLAAVAGGLIVWITRRRPRVMP